METKTKNLLTKELKKPINWLHCKDVLLELGFTKTEITKALEENFLTVDKLTSKESFEFEPRHLSVHEITKDISWFDKKVYSTVIEKGVRVEVEGSVRTKGVEVRIIDNYQHLKDSAIFYTLLKNKFKWFTSFTEFTQKDKNEIKEEYYQSTAPKDLNKDRLKEVLFSAERKASKWDIYHIESFDKEIYLTTSEGSLYIPLNAIMKKDFSIIEKRMEDYFKSWCNNDKKKIKKNLTPLDSIEANQLKEYFKA